VTRVTLSEGEAGSIRVVDDLVIDIDWRRRLRTIAPRRQGLALIGLTGVVVVAGLMVWARPAPPRIAPPMRSEAPGESGPSLLLVHVAGAVRRPGLYELPAGSRVADAIESAGGPRLRADLDALNLAAPVVDGGKVDVPRRGELAPSTPSPGPSGASPVSLNAADAAALESIPGIGPVTAQAIIAARDSLGGFDSLEQLLEVDGIGPATFESIRAYVTL
jgi:competence protein ComEA